MHKGFKGPILCPIHCFNNICLQAETIKPELQQEAVDRGLSIWDKAASLEIGIIWDLKHDPKTFKRSNMLFTLPLLRTQFYEC